MQPQDLLKIFLSETDDLFSDLEQGLIVLEKDPTDDDAINRIFRAAHTFKGSAGMVGIDAVVDFAHVAENVLDRIREKKLSASHELVTILLEAVDVLKDLIARLADTGACELTAGHRAVQERLRAYLDAPTKEAHADTAHAAAKKSQPRAPGAANVFEVRMAFREDIFATGQDPAWLVDELAEIGKLLEVEVMLDKVPELESIEPYTCYLAWRVVVRTERDRSAIDGIFIFVKEENDIIIRDVTADYHDGVDVEAADKKLGELLVEEGVLRQQDLHEALGQQKRVGELLVGQGKVQKEVLDKVVQKQEAARNVRRNSSIRVDTDRLDKLVNLVGELVISVAQVNSRTRDPQSAADVRIAAVEALEQISRDLQEQVMGLRMVPVEDTFARFNRAVRDLATETGKSVLLEMSGTETELDKNVIEQLVDPLKHMVRNCIGHGIESPAERIAAGKSDTGRIFLRASQREGHIVIEVADDGKGIDTEVVLAKAIEKGLVPEGRKLTEKQVYDLLFEPGFSTAKEVNEISGRGVGMDVVKQNVEALRGTIEVESEVGRGTTFRIKLPLTLAIIDGMNVKVGQETVTIPLLSVIELIEHRPDVIKTLEGRGEMVDVRGEILPVIRLHEVFDFSRAAEAAHHAKVVVIENEGRKFGLLVDQVLGMEQAVIKPLDKSFHLIGRLGRSFRKPEGIAGATILGDGSIGLILDVFGIERMAFGGGDTVARA